MNVAETYKLQERGIQSLAEDQLAYIAEELQTYPSTVDLPVKVHKASLRIFGARHSSNSFAFAITAISDEDNPIGFMDFYIDLYYEEYGRTARGGGNFFNKSIPEVLERKGLSVQTEILYPELRRYGDEVTFGNSLHVNSDHRKQGIGELLFFSALQICSKLDVMHFGVQDSTNDFGKSSSYYSRFIEPTGTPNLLFPTSESALESMKLQGLKIVEP